ncbi:MAG TPA: hypothetical protein VM580_33830 [Labilithrix sp.]|nr:hypothetical protein [Labilithrix sp.]
MTGPERPGKLLDWGLRPVFLAAAISLIALVPRWDWATDEHAPRLYVYGDMEIYLERGRALLSHFPSAADTFTPIGYPAFLHLLDRIWPNRLDRVAEVQAALSAVTAGLGSLFARSLDRSAVTQIVAGLALAAYFPLTLYTGFLLTETLFAFLLIAGLLALARSLRPNSTRPLLAAVGAGVLLGFGVLVRPALLFFVPLLAAMGMVASRTRRASLTALATIALVIVPVCVMNSMALKRPSLVASNGGVNFFLAHSECKAVRSDGPGAVFVSTHYNRTHYEKECWFDVPFYEERVFYHAGLAELAAHPGRLVRAFGNLREGLGLAARSPWPNLPYWPGTKRHQEQINDYSRAFFWVILLPAAGHGLMCFAKARRARRLDLTSPRALGWATLMSVFVALYLYNGNPRVRVSSDPICIAFAAAALTAVARSSFEFARGRRAKRATPA